MTPSPVTTRPATPGCRCHEFAADAPRRLWLADTTEHWTGQGKLYLCAIKGAYSNRIVGYSIDSWIKSRIAGNALNNAVVRVTRRPIVSYTPIRGPQSRSRKLVRTPAHHVMVGSMRRVGAAGDNAAIDSFFALPGRLPWPPIGIVSTVPCMSKDAQWRDRLGE